MNLFDLTHPNEDSQGSLGFPQSLTEKYRPQGMSEFAGLDKQKKILANFCGNPYPCAWLFQGASGTGKTTMALAMAKIIPAEVHHIPSQECNVENIDRVRRTCQYVPMSGFRMHLVLVDEADQMSPAAQVSLLSKLDSTNFPPATVFVFTCNAVDRLEPRFLSRCKVLEFSSYGMSSSAVELLTKVWNLESKGAPLPNLARIVKESNNNIRESLNRLETELLSL